MQSYLQQPLEGACEQQTPSERYQFDTREQFSPSILSQMLAAANTKDSLVTVHKLSTKGHTFRSEFIGWLDDEKKDYNRHITPDILTYAVRYLDTFLDELNSQPNVQQLETSMDFDLVGRACLLLSSKVHCGAYDFLTAAEVAQMGCVYEVEDLVAMERDLLEVLDYKLFPSIPHTSSSLIIQSMVSMMDSKETVKVANYCHDLLHHAVCNQDLLQSHSSFALGAAAVFVAIEDVGSGMTTRVGRNIRLSYLKGGLTGGGGGGGGGVEGNEIRQAEIMLKAYVCSRVEAQKNEKRTTAHSGTQRTVRKASKKRKGRKFNLRTELVAALMALDDGRVGSSVISIQKILKESRSIATTAIEIRDCLVKFRNTFGGRRSGRWILVCEKTVMV